MNREEYFRKEDERRIQEGRKHRIPTSGTVLSMSSKRLEERMETRIKYEDSGLDQMEDLMKNDKYCFTTSHPYSFGASKGKDVYFYRYRDDLLTIGMLRLSYFPPHNYEIWDLCINIDERDTSTKNIFHDLLYQAIVSIYYNSPQNHKVWIGLSPLNEYFLSERIGNNFDIAIDALSDFGFSNPRIEVESPFSLDPGEYIGLELEWPPTEEKGKVMEKTEHLRKILIQEYHKNRLADFKSPAEEPLFADDQRGSPRMKFYNSQGKKWRTSDYPKYYMFNQNLTEVPTRQSSEENVFNYVLTCVKENNSQTTTKDVAELWEGYQSKKPSIIDYLSKNEEEYYNSGQYKKSREYTDSKLIIQRIAIPVASEEQLRRLGVRKDIAEEISQIIGA